uniref:Uncharacterized protein n=1 Tax=Oryza sativa subsp. japonica TaxID=39947 RepID=Q5Z7Q3_ORYSJ|nr:hypothetical protein [Oryza sativa Japonica Group]BAD61803.1 hypothetical protein [Oryza sativa Japonica Group]
MLWKIIAADSFGGCCGIKEKEKNGLLAKVDSFFRYLSIRLPSYSSLMGSPIQIQSYTSRRLSPQVKSMELHIVQALQPPSHQSPQEEEEEEKQQLSMVVL